MRSWLTMLFGNGNSQSQNMSSPAGGNRPETPEEIIDILYRAVLRRPPDQGGHGTYCDLLRAGMSELEIVQHLVRSKEFRETKLVTASEFRLLSDR